MADASRGRIGVLSSASLRLLPIYNEVRQAGVAALRSPNGSLRVGHPPVCGRRSHDGRGSVDLAGSLRLLPPCNEMRQAGVEPATQGLGRPRSIQFELLALVGRLSAPSPKGKTEFSPSAFPFPYRMIPMM